MGYKEALEPPPMHRAERLFPIIEILRTGRGRS